MKLKAGSSPDVYKVKFQPNDFPAPELIAEEYRRELPEDYIGTSADPWLAKIFNATITATGAAILYTESLMFESSYQQNELLELAARRFRAIDHRITDDLGISFEKLISLDEAPFTSLQATYYLFLEYWLTNCRYSGQVVFRDEWEGKELTPGVSYFEAFNKIKCGNFRNSDRGLNDFYDLAQQDGVPYAPVERLFFLRCIIRGFDFEDSDFEYKSLTTEQLFRLAYALSVTEVDFTAYGKRSTFLNLAQGLEFDKQIELLNMPAEWWRELRK